MRLVLAVCAFAVGLLLTVPRIVTAQNVGGELTPAVVSAPSRSSAATNDLVTNVFVDTDVRQALQDVAAQTGTTIIADQSVTGQVSCDLKQTPLEKALQIILAGTGYEVMKTADYYLVYSPDANSPIFAHISQTETVKLQNVDADATVKLLSPSYKDFVQADPKSRIIVVTAPESLVKRIITDIRKIDVSQRHVMLQVRVVAMEAGNLLQIGLHWDWPTVSAGAFSDSFQHGKDALPGGSWPWGIRVGYTPGKEFTNSLLMTLSLLAQNDEALIVAKPQVMALDGKEAKISLTTEEYFQIIAPGSYYVQAQLEKIVSGTTLKMTPRIGGNNEITLDVDTEVSDVVARSQNDLPVVTRRTATSTVRIEDGGTVAMAGLMDDRSQAVHSRVPGLGSIPILGYLFRDTSKQQATRQVCIFITADIVPESASRATQEPEDRPVIKPVGKEFRLALQKSLVRLNQERE